MSRDDQRFGNDQPCLFERTLPHPACTASQWFFRHVAAIPGSLSASGWYHRIPRSWSLVLGQTFGDVKG